MSQDNWIQQACNAHGAPPQHTPTKTSQVQSCVTGPCMAFQAAKQGHQCAATGRTPLFLLLLLHTPSTRQSSVEHNPPPTAGTSMNPE